MKIGKRRNEYFREDGTWSLLDFEHNIVPAVQRYEENGGEY